MDPDIDSLLSRANTLLSSIYRELDEFSDLNDSSGVSESNLSPTMSSNNQASASLTLYDGGADIERLNRAIASTERNLAAIGFDRERRPRSRQTEVTEQLTDPVLIDLSDIDNTDDDIIIINPPIETVDLCSPITSNRQTRNRTRLRRVDNHSNYVYPSHSVEVISPACLPLFNEKNTNDSITEGGPCACPICMDSCLKSLPTTTPCGHVFCQKCIREALKRSKSCPICKKKVTERGLTRLYF